MILKNKCTTNTVTKKNVEREVMNIFLNYRLLTKTAVFVLALADCYAMQEVETGKALSCTMVNSEELVYERGKGNEIIDNYMKDDCEKDLGPGFLPSTYSMKKYIEEAKEKNYRVCHENSAFFSFTDVNEIAWVAHGAKSFAASFSKDGFVRAYFETAHKKKLECDEIPEFYDIKVSYFIDGFEWNITVEKPYFMTDPQPAYRIGKPLSMSDLSLQLVEVGSLVFGDRVRTERRYSWSFSSPLFDLKNRLAYKEAASREMPSLYPLDKLTKIKIEKRLFSKYYLPENTSIVKLR